MATHSSVLTWRISGMAEPGGLLSMGSHRVGHGWSDLAAAAAASYSIFIASNYNVRPPSGKVTPCQYKWHRDTGLILGPRRSPGEGSGNPLQYSCLGNSMVRGAWRLQSMGSQRSDTTEHTHTNICPLKILAKRKLLPFDLKRTSASTAWTCETTYGWCERLSRMLWKLPLYNLMAFTKMGHIL